MPSPSLIIFCFAFFLSFVLLVTFYWQTITMIITTTFILIKLFTFPHIAFLNLPSVTLTYLPQLLLTARPTQLQCFSLPCLPSLDGGGCCNLRVSPAVGWRGGGRLVERGRAVLPLGSPPLRLPLRRSLLVFIFMRLLVFCLLCFWCFNVGGVPPLLLGLVFLLFYYFRCCWYDG